MTDKILIRGVNWIGDAVMTMPAIRALRKAYPESKLSLLVKSSVVPVFAKNQDIDEIIVYEDRYKGVFGRLKLAYALRKKGFSKAVLFQNAFDAALISFLAGIPERIGYDRDSRKFLLTKPIPFNNDDRKLHHMDYYLNILKAMEIPADCSDPWIHLSIDERLSARNILSQLKRPVLGINSGAAYGPAKRWLPERFAEVAGWFIKDTGGSVVIFGGRDEEHIAYEIDKRLPENKLFLAGKTSIRELISIISECDAFLTNDSGPMHVAYAVGTPLIVIFGSTDPELTGPSGDNNTVIKADVACSPCFERECKKRDTRCMYSVSSEEVYFAVKDMLPSTKAVFFDRDGTLCKDADYLNKWNDFEVFPDIKSIETLKEKDFMLIGVSNQSGIARGIVNEPFVREVNNLFIDKYGFDDFYYCPHGPHEHCSCRKPEPGMLFTARDNHKIDLKASFVVGDKDADMLLARAVGAKGILVRTGKQQESEHADFTVSNLKEAADLIMHHG